MRVLTALIFVLAFGLSSIFDLSVSKLNAGDVGASDSLSFNQDIRPLLSDRCFSCHGPDAEHRQADLRLDDESSAKAYAIEAGDPQESLIIQRIRATDPDVVMPPPEMRKPLSEQEIRQLEQWITAGANYAPHWAYVPPTKHIVPQVSEPETNNPDWSNSWIDRFVLAKLDEACPRLPR